MSRFSGLGYPCTADRPSHGSLVDLEPQHCKPQLASCWYDEEPAKYKCKHVAEDDADTI